MNQDSALAGRLRARKNALAMSAAAEAATPTTAPEAQPTTAPEPVEPPEPVEAPTTEEPIPMTVGQAVTCGDMAGEILEVLPEQVAYRVKCGEKEYMFAAAGVVAAEAMPEAPAGGSEMKQIAAALGLNPDATSEEIEAEARRLKGAVTQATTSMREAQLSAAGCRAEFVTLLAGTMGEAGVEGVKAAYPSAFASTATASSAPVAGSAAMPDPNALAAQAKGTTATAIAGRVTPFGG